MRQKGLPQMKRSCQCCYLHIMILILLVSFAGEILQKEMTNGVPTQVAAVLSAI